MNTPEPCDSCKHLYANAMEKENPAYMAECKKGYEMGVKTCLGYRHWKTHLERNKDIANQDTYKEKEE